MRTVIEMAREAGLAPIYEACDVPDVSYAYESWDVEIERFAALVRADERGRMCEQLKECSSENSTSNEANRSAVLGEGGQAN